MSLQRRARAYNMYSVRIYFVRYDMSALQHKAQLHSKTYFRTTTNAAQVQICTIRILNIYLHIATYSKKLPTFAYGLFEVDNIYMFREYKCKTIVRIL